jgi:hypothetical protein
VSDDMGGRIYRITFGPPTAGSATTAAKQ